MLIVILGNISTDLMFPYFTSVIVEALLIESENGLPIIISIILMYIAYVL